MKKILIILAFFLIIPTVHAANTIRCMYTVEGYLVTFVVDAKANIKNGTVKVKTKSYNSEKELKFIVGRVKKYSNFYSKNSLKCPKNIYSKSNSKGVVLDFKKNNNYVKSKLSNKIIDDEEEIAPTDWGKIEDTDLKTICSKPELRKPLKFIGTLVTVLKIAIPILIVVFGIIDLFKSIPNSKDDRIMIAVKSIGIRFIAGIFIFFIPGIVELIFDWVNEWSNYQNTWCCCTQCILDSGKCDVNSCSSDSCKIGGMN